MTVETPVLNISYEAFSKMVTASQIVEDKHKDEVLGLLVVEEGKNGKGLTVTDIIIPEQTIGCASCEMVIGETISQKEIPTELVPKIKGWWHSHKHMGAFFSVTDDTTLENWAYALPYAIGVVVSLPNTIKAFLQYGKPYLTKQIEMDVKVNFPDNNTLRSQLEQELDQKIKKPPKKPDNKHVKHYSRSRKLCDVSDCLLTAKVWVPQGNKKETLKFCQDHYEAYKLGNIITEDTQTKLPTDKELAEQEKHIAWLCGYLRFDLIKGYMCLETGKTPDCRFCANNPIKKPLSQPQQPTQPAKTQPTDKPTKKPLVWFDCPSLQILTKHNKIVHWYNATRKQKKLAIQNNSLLCNYLREVPSCEFCGVYVNRTWVKTNAKPTQETIPYAKDLIIHVKRLPNCSFPNCPNKATVLEAFSGNDKKPVCDQHITDTKHKLRFYKVVGD